jgi:hypothetical protein
MDAAFAAYIMQHAALAPLLGNRFWLDVAKTKEEYPYIVYGLDEYRSVGAMGGASALAQSDYELMVYAQTTVSGHAVADALRLALDGRQWFFDDIVVRRAWLGPMRSAMEEELAGGQRVLYQRTATYHVWHTRTI